MKVQNLVKNRIYTDILDKDIPLMFTGKIVNRVQYGTSSKVAFFTPVKTDKNKNWYNSVPVITKAFDLESGNQYIN